MRLSGRLGDARRRSCSASCRGCDEPGGSGHGARRRRATCLQDFPGPVLFGFPSGHTTTPLVSLPFGVRTRVVADGRRPRLVLEEAAAAE